MIVSVSDDGESFVQRCAGAGCGAERTLRTHPTFGDVRIDHDALAQGDTFTTPPCPHCGAVECFRLDLAPHETGDAPQPGTLVGQVLPGGGVVHEHWVGWLPDQAAIAHARHLRRLNQHAAVQAARAAARARR